MKVRINEVGPRDGLQSQGKTLTVESRLSLIQSLVKAGLKNLEAGSFVSPKAVPQMAGTDELFALLPERSTVRYAGLVPNMKGYEFAVAAGANVVNVVLSVTETMNQKNIRMSLPQTADVCVAIIERGRREGIAVQAYLAVAFECPFEGLVEPAVVARYAKLVKQAGASKIIIADTIGAANPEQVRRLLDAVISEVGSDILSCHFHDTRGMALANITVALDRGVREFDSSIGGLGGCPFSPGATGNVATEDVVLLLNSMGHDTGIDPLDLIPVINAAEQLTGVSLGGKSFRWLSQPSAKVAGEARHGG
ncbi:MAG TPA: hydroxymethylglutaryl-CoA lyase [Marinobacter sp.]|uniref:Hydroxymethylglutaryl-CoA lyase n=2 Tax=root TaxID=1 RepID=A0A831VTK3_9GAMM|nr:hydroxymethylglutaryl-CoA lyase [Marinobacter antarcticus]HDZ37246.1 hydroxymethylglutaryl-CoA lyase [Marinobacter sp.]HEA50818.1 hydroxymethylglutaryl-CoA lyase [Marinobacter antarcticus]